MLVSHTAECLCESESEVTQLSPTLCDPVDCSPPGSSVGFSRQEYWSGLPFSSPGDLPDPGIEPRSPALRTDVLTSEPPGGHQYVYVLYTYLFTQVLSYGQVLYL